MSEFLHDRRRALRVNLRTHTNLTTADGGCAAHLLNISETGALVAVIEPHQLSAGEAITLDIELPEGQQARLEGHVAHVKEHLLGLDCTPATEVDAERIEAAVGRLSAF